MAARNHSRHRRRNLLHRCRLERLENRRLLVAEGTPFTFNQDFSAAGLVGDISAQVDWGDGTSSAVTSNGGDGAGAISVRFDYSLDQGNFFGNAGSPQRRAIEFAADSFASRFNDNLTAIGTSEFVEVRPNIFHPRTGQLHQLPINPIIAENEIVIYAGSRSLTGNTAGLGGPGGVGFNVPSITCQTQAECDQIQAEINEFADNLNTRGQAGAAASPATDYSVAIGAITFDDGADRDWYFGIDPSGIQNGQTDFITIATHELAHAFGFGLAESWQTNVSGGTFVGPDAVAAYQGSGNVPLVRDAGGAFSHWAEDVVNLQDTIMGEEVIGSARQLFSPIDFGAMSDIGWDVIGITATVTGEHRYADDGTYSAELRLTGSQGGERNWPIQDVVVTNVAPTLSVPDNQNRVVNQPFTIQNIGEITDPGFSNSSSSPATTESFTYSVNWGDGTVVDGNATIDSNGNSSGQLTQASFDLGHQYETAGVKTVTVSITDDDDGTTSDTFQINVIETPRLTVTASASSVSEDAGAGAASITVARSGPVSSVDEVITLSSGDVSELRLPSSVTILAGESSAIAAVDAIDDNLLDASQQVTITAEAAGRISGETTVNVTDAESIAAALSATSVVEGSDGAVTLTVSRSNTDTADALNIMLSGGFAGLGLVSPVVIASGAQQVQVDLIPVDDTDAELTESVSFSISATGYTGASASIDLLDDEPPLFQNQDAPFDVNGEDGVTARDALIVINAIARRLTDQLDPSTESPDGFFIDVNGDYRATALDALQVINQLARVSSSTSSPETELFVPQSLIANSSLSDRVNDDAIASLF